MNSPHKVPKTLRTHKFERTEHKKTYKLGHKV